MIDMARLAGDLTCDELHAVSAGIATARDVGFISADMKHHDSAVVLARCEARIAVRKARGLGLTQAQLEQAAVEAVHDLLRRTRKTTTGDHR